jgi:hypothetical protein
MVARVIPVMNMIMSEHPELRPKSREVLEIVKEEVTRINRLTLSEQMQELIGLCKNGK